MISNFTSSLSAKLDLLIQKGIYEFGTVYGLNNREIGSLEDRYSLKLPLIYKEFLSVFGKSSTGFLKYSTLTLWPSLTFLTEYAIEQLSEGCEGNLGIRNNVFFISNYEDGEFDYFYCHSNNPKVYRVEYEDCDGFKIADKLSEYLLERIDTIPKVYQDRIHSKYIQKIKDLQFKDELNSNRTLLLLIKEIKEIDNSILLKIASNALIDLLLLKHTKEILCQEIISFLRYVEIDEKYFLMKLKNFNQPRLIELLKARWQEGKRTLDGKNILDLCSDLNIDRRFLVD